MDKEKNKGNNIKEATKDPEFHNFKPDVAMKKLFTHINKSMAIDLINGLVGTDFSNDPEKTDLEFMSTEHSTFLDDSDKQMIRGDLIAKFSSKEDSSKKDRVVIEFQTTTDQSMALRMVAYTFNAITQENPNVPAVSPHSIIIYAKKSGDPRGFDEFSVLMNDFRFDGVDYTKDDKKVITYKFPYINILKNDMEEYKDSKIEILQAFRLYLCKLDTTYICKDNTFNNICEQNIKYLRTLEPNEKVLFSEITNNLLQDIANKLNENPIKNEEELEMVNTRQLTISDIIREESIEEGIEKGIEKGIELGEVKNLWETAPFMLKHAPLKEVVNHFLQKIDLPRQEIVERLTEIAKEQQAKEFESIFDENGNVIPYSGDSAGIELGE